MRINRNVIAAGQLDRERAGEIPAGVGVSQRISTKERFAAHIATTSASSATPAPASAKLTVFATKIAVDEKACGFDDATPMALASYT